MRSLGSAAAVIAAARDDADAEVERIEREAQAALARLAEEAAADPAALPDREVRITAARREARELTAQEDLRDAREALTAREAWLGRAVSEGQRRLAELRPPAERRADLARLAREGLDRLPEGPVEIAVAPADAALCDEGFAREIAAGRALRVVPDEGVARGGVVVRSADGKVSFDNGFEARARRFESIWRAALGAIYEGAEKGP
jgi:vacuolar-type H+-ATPase subunit E/Vma4